ncbi:hypothetical protein FQN49_000918 [Arthroderma sp. PD_2]|nr:hypothetical protein FQN49_000918 [Arthroderma sp. PD_2]
MANTQLEAVEVINLAREKRKYGHYEDATEVLREFLANCENGKRPINVRLEAAITAVSQGFLSRGRAIIIDLISGADGLVSLPRSQTADDPQDELEFLWYNVLGSTVQYGEGLPPYLQQPEIVQKLQGLCRRLLSRHEYSDAFTINTKIKALYPLAALNIQQRDQMCKVDIANLHFANGEPDEAEKCYLEVGHKHGWIDVRMVRLIARAVLGGSEAAVEELDQEVSELTLLYNDVNFPFGEMCVLVAYIGWKATRGLPQQPLHLDMLSDIETRSGSLSLLHGALRERQSPQERSTSQSQEEKTVASLPVSLGPDININAASSEAGMGHIQPAATNIKPTDVVPLETTTYKGENVQLATAAPKKNKWWATTHRSPFSRLARFLKGDFSEKRLSAERPLSILEFVLLARNVIWNTTSQPDARSLAKAKALGSRLPVVLRPGDSEYEKEAREVWHSLKERAETLGDIEVLNEAITRRGGPRRFDDPHKIIQLAESMLQKTHLCKRDYCTLTIYANIALAMAHFRLGDLVKATEYVRRAQAVVDSSPEELISPQVYEQLVSLKEIISHKRLLSTGPVNGSHKPELELVRQQQIELLGKTTDHILKGYISVSLAQIESGLGRYTRARELLSQGQDLVNASSNTRVQSTRFQFYRITTLALLPDATEDDQDTARQAMREFESLRQSDPKLAKNIANEASIVYQGLGTSILSKAQDEPFGPSNTLDDLRQARLYYQAALDAVEFSEAKRGTYLLSAYLTGLAETWEYEGRITKDIDTILSALREYRKVEDLLSEMRREQAVMETDPLEVLLSKQSISGGWDSARLYNISFRCCALGILQSKNDKQRTSFLMEAWAMVQRHKARSIMDILALDVFTPKYLTDLLREDPQQYSLLQKQERLITELSQTGMHRRFAIREELRKLRPVIESYPLLNSITKSRDGESFTPDNLAELSLLSARTRSRIVYVDWACASDDTIVIFAAVAIMNQYEVRINTLGISMETVSAWIKSNLHRHILSNNDLATVKLKELSGLIKPLANMTSPGDIIILCPTGPLHQLPLHALEISDNQVLLERNPVVYTASLSTLRHQIVQQIRPQSGSNNESHSPFRAAVLCVYNEGDRRNPTREVSAVRSSTSELAASVHTKVQFGSQVTVGFYNWYTSDANLIHFHGHAISASRAEDQALVLQEQLSDDQASSSTSPTLDRKGGHLTVRKLFSDTKFTRNPLVVNIACSSGNQEIMRGDEPLGLTTAFLYAGAKAVVGTLWPLRSADGRAFSKYFYENMRNQAAVNVARGEEPLVNLAKAVQEAALKIRDEEETEAAYHWASFIMSGAWEYRFDPRPGNGTGPLHQ